MNSGRICGPLKTAGTQVGYRGKAFFNFRVRASFQTQSNTTVQSTNIKHLLCTQKPESKMQRFKALLPQQTRSSLRTFCSHRRAFSAQPNYSEHHDDDSQEQVTFLACAFFIFYFANLVFNLRRRCLIPDFGRRKSEIASSHSQQAVFAELAQCFNGTVSFPSFFFHFAFWVRSLLWGEVNAKSFSFRRLLGWRGCMIPGKRTLILALFWWRYHYHCRFHANKLLLN